MGNAFRAGPDNGAPHGRDVTVRDRKIEKGGESHNGAFNVGLEVKSTEELRRGRPASPPVRRSLFGEEPLQDAGRETSLRSPELFSPLMSTSPLDSAYGTERKTPSCCPVEPDVNTPDEATLTAFETAETWKTAKKSNHQEDASSIRTSP